MNETAHIPTLIKNSFRSLTRLELLLWLGSLVVLTCSYIASGAGNALSLVSTLLGATSLIFLAKGNVVGHLFGLGFILTYAAVAWTFSYWGEVATYLGMSLPSTLFALASWLSHPFGEESNTDGEASDNAEQQPSGSTGTPQVQVAQLSRTKIVALIFVAIAATGLFYLVLKALDTPNLPVSTLSVTTSALGAGLMFMRSPYYPLGYLANDLVLIVLWTLACREDISYLPVVVNFFVFLANDLYSFVNWQRMKKAQAKHTA